MNCSPRTPQVKRQWNSIYRPLREKDCNSRILYLAKVAIPRLTGRSLRIYRNPDSIFLNTTFEESSLEKTNQATNKPEPRPRSEEQRRGAMHLTIYLCVFIQKRACYTHYILMIKDRLCNISAE